MSPDQLKKWRESMQFSQRKAAKQLGVSLPTYQAMERGTAFATGKPVTIDRRTAYACAAIAEGLAPYGDDTSVASAG